MTVCTPTPPATPRDHRAATRLVVAVVTGSRAEFGLLRTVMHAIKRHSDLELQTLVTGTHLIPPALTMNEVRVDFDVAAEVPMQQAPTETKRLGDGAALGRGIAGFAARFAAHRPDFVLVLGDRIEAFAAASAAAVDGMAVAHMHGGDRAEGVADEGLRHAISKLAHVHLPATQVSANRLVAMGEDPQRVHIVGSPALDGLDTIAPLDDARFAELGCPSVVVLLHPVGDDDDVEAGRAAMLLRACEAHGPVLALMPNHDRGREGIAWAIRRSGVRSVDHLPRDRFIGLLKRIRILAGNSSAGLIECAALGVACMNVGSRQGGREHGRNIVQVPEWSAAALDGGLAAALALHKAGVPHDHPYGDGRCGERTAAVLAGLRHTPVRLHKRNSY